MYFLDLKILTKQTLPPNWRTQGRIAFLTTVLFPFQWSLNAFNTFRKEAKRKAAISAQVMVVEEQVKNITSIWYGVGVYKESRPQHFILKVPVEGMMYEKEITLFLNKTLPAGRNYELIFY